MGSVTIWHWIIGALLILGLAIIVRRLWLAATNPEIAYRLGRKTRRTIEDAAHTAGQTAGSIDGATEFIGRSFREGRDTAKRRDGNSAGGA
jgi:hypothetical protein